MEKKLYVLTEELEFYDSKRDKVVDYSFEIRGVFDNMFDCRALMNKLLERCRAMVGDDQIFVEGIYNYWYRTVDERIAHIEYRIEVIKKLNVELPNYE